MLSQFPPTSTLPVDGSNVGINIDGPNMIISYDESTNVIPSESHHENPNPKHHQHDIRGWPTVEVSESTTCNAGPFTNARRRTWLSSSINIETLNLVFLHH
mmetsp:Transcript_14678/g.29893  ORF Transcript_14678/g.29893 Transcript_14678/m.29893 type:complete len:101 (+) Transcript_14678:854-1156(+)